MRPIIGQQRLVDTLFKYNLQTVPKTMLFLGPSGCGKSWISAAFAEHLQIETVEIDVKEVSADTLVEYYRCPIEKLYLIDLKGVSEKQQNKILKFIEEPSSNMFIILMAESEIGILPTILNRCIKYNFEPYTLEDLKKFDWVSDCDDELVYALCKTPGQLINLTDTNLEALKNFCVKIINNVSKNTYANTLSILLQINCKDEYNKYDIGLFLNMLEYVAFTDYVKTKRLLSFKIYNHVIEQKKEVLNKSIIKESFVLSFLDKLWELAH